MELSARPCPLSSPFSLKGEGPGMVVQRSGFVQRLSVCCGRLAGTVDARPPIPNPSPSKGGRELGLGLGGQLGGEVAIFGDQAG